LKSIYEKKDALMTSLFVTPEGQNSNHFIADLKLLGELVTLDLAIGD